MRDEDLRDLFAGFALMGIISRGINDAIIERAAANAYLMADAMIEAKYAEAEVGIAAVKKRAKRTTDE